MEIITMLMVFSIRIFVAEPFTIPSSSMSPSLEIGDYVVVSKIGYGNYDFFGKDVINTRRYRKVRRGDIMVFEFPKRPQLDYIKRVIGLPGDKITVHGKQLFINEQEIPRTLLSTDKNISRHIESLNGRGYEVLLDDSRHSKKEINVTVPDSHYFVLGDNRDNSNDSRYWGFVPEANLIGKLAYRFRATPVKR